MTPQALESAVRANSRHYDEQLQAVERKLSSIHEQTLCLQSEVLAQLQAIASYQVDNLPERDDQVTLQLSLRNQQEAALRGQLALIEGRIGELLRHIPPLQAQHRQISERVTAGLPGDARHSQGHAACEEARQALQAYRPQHVEISDECAGKLAVFDADTNFSHLRAAGYSTPEYSAGRLVRLMDDWLAKTIGFAVNFNRYRILLAMQAANDARLAELQEAIELRDAELQALLGSLLIAAGQGAVNDKLAAIDDAITAAKGEANVIHGQLEQFVLKTDEHYQRAEMYMLERLGNRSLDELLEAARATPGEQDDIAAQRIREAQEKLIAQQQGEPPLRVEQAQAIKAYERAKRVERAVYDFHRDLDLDSFGYNARLDVHALLALYMLGEVSLETFGGDLAQHKGAPVYNDYSSQDERRSYDPDRTTRREESDPVDSLISGLFSILKVLPGSSSSSSYSTSDSTGGGSYSTSDSF